MKKSLHRCLVIVAALGPGVVWSAPGEYWEVTTKVEMAGLPMAMPARTMKVCIAKGAERNPPPNKDCEMSDVKIVGNKTSWKMRCNQNGEIMTGSGEMTGTPDNSQGTMHMSGKSGGQTFNMTMAHQSRRIGGSCDSEEMINAARAQAGKAKEQLCDTSRFTSTTQWVNSAPLFLKDQTCPGKKEPMCEAVRRDAPRDVDVYRLWLAQDKASGGLIASACGLNPEVTLKALCRTVSHKNVVSLTSLCPAEVKAYREAARRKDCEGRSFTSRDGMGKCLGGDASADADSGSEEVDLARTRGKGSARVQQEATDEAQPKWGASRDQGAVGAPNAVPSVLDGAKKLKGLFGL